MTLTVADAIGVLQANRKQLNFGGYVGDAIAAQNVGLSFTGANTATWTATGPAWLTLAPAGGTVSIGAPVTMTVGIDAGAITEAGVYTDTLVVSDGATTQRIVVALRLLPPGAPTSELFGLEVTQGIQNLFNDIPFVAERPAFARAHVRVAYWVAGGEGDRRADRHTRWRRLGRPPSHQPRWID